jgi:flagellar basal-body rod modification protein FlgD
MADTTTTSSVTSYDSVYTPNAAARVAPQKTLGQDDFLKLLTTQMMNQDPTNPVDNTKMIADMAQFSSLQAMKDLNTTSTGMLTQMKMSQALQASGLVGKNIVDAGTKVTIREGETPVLQLEADKAYTDVKIQIQDESGRTVRTATTDSISSGITDSGWTGIDDAGNTLPPGKYSVLAYGLNDAGGSEQISTLVSLRVSSVDLNATGAVVNLEDGTSTTLDQIKQIH